MVLILVRRVTGLPDAFPNSESGDGLPCFVQWIVLLSAGATVRLARLAARRRCCCAGPCVFNVVVGLYALVFQCSWPSGWLDARHAVTPELQLGAKSAVHGLDRADHDQSATALLHLLTTCASVSNRRELNARLQSLQFITHPPRNFSVQ